MVAPHALPVRKSSAFCAQFCGIAASLAQKRLLQIVGGGLCAGAGKRSGRPLSAAPPGFGGSGAAAHAAPLWGPLRALRGLFRPGRGRAAPLGLRGLGAVGAALVRRPSGVPGAPYGSQGAPLIVVPLLPLWGGKPVCQGRSRAASRAVPLDALLPGVIVGA